MDFTGFGEYSSRDIIVEISGNIDYTIEDLDMSIVATRSISANPNMATITVYNLAQSTRELLSSSIYDYANNESVCDITFSLDDEEVYSGDIINVVHTRKPQEGEYITVFYCGDGSNAVKQTTEKEYSKGSNVGDIVDDLIGDLDGIKEGTIQNIKDCIGQRTLLRALTINGKIIDNIKKLIKNCTSGDSETDVYIDNKTINIVPKNETLDISSIDITSDLLDAPSLTEQGATVIVKFSTDYTLNAPFAISSRNNTTSYANLTQNKLKSSQVQGIGAYQISEIKHTIDNFSKNVATAEIVGVLNSKVTSD